MTPAPKKTVENISAADAKQRIQRIRKIYAQFSQEISDLMKHQNEIITGALRQIDQQKIQHILDHLDSSHGQRS